MVSIMCWPRPTNRADSKVVDYFDRKPNFLHFDQRTTEEFVRVEKLKFQEESSCRDEKSDAPGLIHPCVARLTEWVEDELPGAGDQDEVVSRGSSGLCQVNTPPLLL